MFINMFISRETYDFPILDKLSDAQDNLGELQEIASKEGMLELENILIQIDMLIAEAIDAVA